MAQILLRAFRTLDNIKKRIGGQTKIKNAYFIEVSAIKCFKSSLNQTFLPTFLHKKSSFYAKFRFKQTFQRLQINYQKKRYVLRHWRLSVEKIKPHRKNERLHLLIFADVSPNSESSWKLNKVLIKLTFEASHEILTVVMPLVYKRFIEPAEHLRKII